MQFWRFEARVWRFGFLSEPTEFQVDTERRREQKKEGIPTLRVLLLP